MKKEKDHSAKNMKKREGSLSQKHENTQLLTNLRARNPSAQSVNAAATNNAHDAGAAHVLPIYHTVP